LRSRVKIIDFDILLSRDDVYCGLLFMKSRNPTVFAKFPETDTFLSVRMERENVCSMYVRTFGN